MNDPDAATDAGGKAMVKFNKKKYNELKETLSNQLPPDYVEITLQAIRNVLKFDPDVKTYTPEQLQKQKEFRVKAAEAMGLSMYEYTFKNYYENNKEKCHERVKNYRRGIAALKKSAEVVGC